MNARRIKMTVKRVGEAYTVGAATGYGVFGPLSPTQATRYLPTTVVETNAPLTRAIVAGDDGTATEDTLTLRGDDHTVLYAGDVCYRGVVVARVLIFSSLSSL